MADTKKIIDSLVAHGAGLFTGVPDSLLSKFSACVIEQETIPHIIAANEGNAIGLAIGDYLATKRPAVIYMQNSGLGNVVNPVTSLADPAVYSIPMILVIGWRGEPGIHDEPQHIKQGEITLEQLDVLGVPYLILSQDSDVELVISQLWETMLDRQGPVALVVRKGALSGTYPVKKKKAFSSLKREEALDCLLNWLPESSFLVATTGKTGRELFELRENSGEKQRDFLTVGGMGHASSIALGVALNKPQIWTVCLDGDGAVLMHLGAMATLTSAKPERYLHVVLNNYAHESVGGQPTVADLIDFKKLSESLGYTGYRLANTKDQIQSSVEDILSQKGCWLLEIQLTQGSRDDLGRPKATPLQNKEAVMSFLQTECLK